MNDSADGARLDRWLWAARFFRTRAQAKQAIDGGKVQVDGGRAKPSRMVRVGDQISVTRGEERMDVTVCALSERRGGAPQAQLLYDESAVSLERRTVAKENRRLTRGSFIAPPSRPNKRDRRAISRLKSERANE